MYSRRVQPEAAFLFKVLEREESADEQEDEEDREDVEILLDILLYLIAENAQRPGDDEESPGALRIFLTIIISLASTDM